MGVVEWCLAHLKSFIVVDISKRANVMGFTVVIPADDLQPSELNHHDLFPTVCPEIVT